MLGDSRPGKGIWCSLGGRWYEAETDFIFSRLHTSDVFVDVGANVGAYTLQAAKMVGLHGRVIAFEPTSHTCSRLIKNIELNQFSNIKVIEAAAGDSVGETEFIICESDNSNYMSGSLISQRNEVQRVRVKVDTIDAVLEREGTLRLDWLKIDAEGAEEKVLQGAKQSIRKFWPSILVEISGGCNGDAARFLVELGYSLHILTESGKLSALPEEFFGNCIALKQ